jgi:putative DNA primase/helicase
VPANKLLSKFGLIAHLKHGGDYSACAKALKAEGYGAVAPSQVVPLTIVEGGAVAVEFPLTDLGNAERLIHEHGENLRYCHLWGRWLNWDGSRWIVDETGGAKVFQLAHSVVRNMQQAASLIEDKDKRQAMAKFSYGCESKSRLSNMVEIAKTLQGVPVSPDELDTHNMLLNCKNGTLDLKTCELREHSRSDLITKSTSINYNVDATCPNWLNFLRRTFNEDAGLIRFIWKACGYSLTGHTVEHRMLFGYGATGNNGKSTLIEAVLHAFGDYGCTTPTDTLMTKNGDAGISNDIARLKGMRMVVAPETEDGKRLNEGLIKRLTGGDTITARFMRQEYFDFRPEFKLWMVGNHKPVIRGTDDAIWRRITLIPFDVTIPKEERDRDLGRKLREEAEGILAWMIDGLAAWNVEGLEAPSRIEEAGNEYRQESDILGAFLDECTVKNERGSIKASKLYGAYQEWCKRTGEYCVTQTRFGRAMHERGMGAIKKRDSNDHVGISLIEPDLSHVYRGGE